MLERSPEKCPLYKCSPENNVLGQNVPRAKRPYCSVAHVWLPGAKTTGPIAKVCFFLNVIFMSVIIFSFNAIHSVIKNMFHKVQLPPMGPVRKGIFCFWIFFNETWHICRWA
jgi:hypothetical protein